MARRLAVGDEVACMGDRGKILKVLPASGAALLQMHVTLTTRWAFLHEVTAVTASTSWSPSAFPTMLQSFLVQGSPTSNENLVVFLHGLGDTHESLFTLGQAMQLPQTAFASFRATHALPFELGFAWFDPSLDDQGDVLPHNVHDARRLASLHQVVGAWMGVLAVLQTVYNWPLHRIFLMGFGHGGTVALHVAAACADRLGGVVSVSGALLSTANVLKTATPGVVLHSSLDPLIPIDMFQATAAAMPTVKTKSFDYHPIGLSNKAEMETIMKFFDETLYLRNLALEQQADVFEL